MQLCCANTNYDRDIRSSGEGVTTVPFVDFSVREIFELSKVHVRFFKSHPYFRDAAAAKLQRHLSIMNMIFYRQPVFWWLLKLGKWRNGEIGSVTPTSGPRFNRNKHPLYITLTPKLVRCCLKSSAFRVFTHPFVQAQIKSIKAPRHWPLSGESVDSPHKGPVTWKMFLFDDAIMVLRWPTVSDVKTYLQWRIKAYFTILKIYFGHCQSI